MATVSSGVEASTSRRSFAPPWTSSRGRREGSRTTAGAGRASTSASPSSTCTAGDRSPKCARTTWSAPWIRQFLLQRTRVLRGRPADEAPAHVGGAVASALPQRGLGALPPGQHGARQPAVPHHGEEVGPVAGDDNLDHLFGQAERSDEVGQGQGALLEQGGGGGQHSLGDAAEPMVAGQRAEPEKGIHGECVG